MKVVSTKVTNPEWEALVDKCNEKGTTIAEYLRELLEKDCDNVARPGASTNQKEQTAAQSLLDRIKNRRTTEQPKPESGQLYELLRRSK